MKSKTSDEIKKELDQRRGNLRHRKGGWLIGKGVYSHGEDLMRDLLPNKTYFHVLILNATGRMPEDRFCRWLEAIYICLSWPDPRIWCNTIGSFGGTARASIMGSTIAGLIASESKLYGPRTLIAGVEFITSCLQAIDSGQSLSDAVSKLGRYSRGNLHIAGYLRPIADGDDRVSIMEEFAASLGYPVDRHLALAKEVEKFLKAEYNQSMNVGGYMSAFLADRGFTSAEVLSLFPAMVSSGVTACSVEESNHPPGYFLPLQCEDVSYTGVGKRSLPDKFVSR